MVIFTTLQAQDFPDVDGDAAIGRVTFPIYAPEFSRIVTLLSLGFWSAFLAWVWGLGVYFQVGFITLGGIVGLRYYLCRSVKQDQRSYILFNVSVFLISLDADPS
jgi:4-hydroxybenzoate polyprenyltransferase